MNQPLKPLPDGLLPLATELRAYYRELPRLLEEGGNGKYFVAKGETGYGVWDTFGDAVRFGHHVFADGKFMAQKIDHRHLAALAEYFGPHPTAEAEVA